MEPRNAPSTKDKAVSNAAQALDAEMNTGDACAPADINAFFMQVEKRAWRVARFALRDNEQAMDAVQDAMLRLTKYYRNKPAEEWPPLFWTILRRRIVDLQRRRKVRSIVVGWLGGGPDGQGGKMPVWEPADDGPGPAQHLHDQQAMDALQQAVNRLPRRQHETFMLRVLEDMNVADTAEAMGCSEGSVKTHLSRAMHALRDQLEDWK